ncbi:restriction endonuclease subunit S, partial [Listeria monocytogenes]
MKKLEKSVPVIRFKGFSEAWEQRKLGELGEVTTGKAFSSTSFDNQGEYLVITNKNISDSSRSQNIITNRISISDDEIIQRYRLDGENILVTMDGVNLGKTAMYSNANALLAQRVGRIKSNQLEFIYQITSSNTFLRTMQTLSVGNAIKHISLKQISEYSSLGPKDIIERKKIGSFFKKLDNAIALHQRKL